jgi:hypothetical protein
MPPEKPPRIRQLSPHLIYIDSPMRGHGLYQAIARTNRLKAGIDPNEFVAERSRVHETYIREHEKTKRLSLTLSAILLAVACLVVVFAPEGREVIAHGVGVALFITSAGAAGYTKIWGGVRNIRLGAGRNVTEVRSR